MQMDGSLVTAQRGIALPRAAPPPLTRAGAAALAAAV